MITVQITHRGIVSIYPIVTRTSEYMQGCKWFTTNVPDVSAQTECAIQALTGFKSFGELIGYAFIEGDAVEQDDIGVIDDDDIGFSFCILIDGKPATYEQVNASLNPIA